MFLYNYLNCATFDFDHILQNNMEHKEYIHALLHASEKRSTLEIA
jgi:hypothetical protein